MHAAARMSRVDTGDEGYYHEETATANGIALT
jgi:hypothetical protein